MFLFRASAMLAERLAPEVVSGRAALEQDTPTWNSIGWSGKPLKCPNVATWP